MLFCLVWKTAVALADENARESYKKPTLVFWNLWTIDDGSKTLARFVVDNLAVLNFGQCAAVYWKAKQEEYTTVCECYFTI